MVEHINKQEIDKVIEIIIPIVNSHGACGVNYGVRTYFKTDQKGMQDHIIDKVVAKISENGEYVFYIRDLQRHGYDYNIFRNPNFELNESIKAANVSTKELNSLLKKTNKWAIKIAVMTAIFIAIQLIFSILSYISTEKKQDDLLQVRQQIQELQEHVKKQDSLFQANIHQKINEK